MRKKIIVITSVAVLSLGGVIATAEAGNARDTGWDCPGCKKR